MPDDSLGNMSGAEGARDREKEKEREDEVCPEIMEERPSNDISPVTSSNKDKLRGRPSCAVSRAFQEIPIVALRNHPSSPAGPMIDVKLCKNCRPVLEREREARFFRVGYFSSLWQTRTKSLRQKQSDIILEISRRTDIKFL